jgi:hypothetical protein
MSEKLEQKRLDRAWQKSTRCLARVATDVPCPCCGGAMILAVASLGWECPTCQLWVYRTPGDVFVAQKGLQSGPVPKDNDGREHKHRHCRQVRDGVKH